MAGTPSSATNRRIYKFSKLDNFSFNFFSLQSFIVTSFLFYLELTYVAWGSIPIFLLFLYFSNSKKYSFSQKAIAASLLLIIYFTFSFALYGKTFNFIVLLYIIPIVLLIIIRYHKLMFNLILLIITTVSTTIYFDFFGFDYGNKIYYEKNIYNIFFYFIVIMILIYLIVLLTARTNLVKYIIEDLKTKNNELEESRIELRKLQINKESFFAIMSHEIRTPLNAIKGISDILKNNIQSEEDQNLLELMDYSSNHLLALVNNILDFTKLNDGVFSLQYSEFNLGKSLNSLFKMNERLALEKGLKFEIQTSTDIPHYVYGDKNRINQIVLNLLNNAIEYTKIGTVKMLVTGNYNSDIKKEFLLQITISDTGKGIDKELGEKLFQKYATSNTSKNSVGLGLTISKGLIDLMNGSISFDSEPNEGTTFHITIPLPIVENNSTNSDNVDNNFKDTAIKILLVDDNKINLLVLEKQLKNKLKNSQLTTANNGLEALNLIKEHQYDIVLMDVIMPIMDGKTATKHVRNLTDDSKKNIPIIALTANVGEKELTECLNAGMTDFVTKPFEVNALLKIISKNYKPEEQHNHSVLS
ncbi:Signal transduction histidine kinase [Flavobacterium degerlachei]|uniref:histidine kinase n=2 Tax=Flavobacterium degerlachei TaxID=229203 RepID=A0A1H3FNC2_9FLAO|nr:Signal transduction histidine kinase [Flavobacterium degerlachei]